MPVDAKEQIREHRAGADYSTAPIARGREFILVNDGMKPVLECRPIGSAEQEARIRVLLKMTHGRGVYHVTSCWSVNSPFNWSLRLPSPDRLRAMVYPQDTSQTPPVHRALCVRCSTGPYMKDLFGWVANGEDLAIGSSFTWRKEEMWPAVLCGLSAKALIRIS